MKFDNLKTWLYEVSRGYTLPMSLLPCLVAVACGYKLGGNVFYGILATIGVVSAHLGTNVFDDFIDHITKTPKQKCKTAYLDNNFTTPKKIFVFAMFYFCVAAIIGLFFLSKTGWQILIPAIVGGLICLTYPKLTRFCLGEISLALAFGPLLFGGISYVMLNVFSLSMLLLSIPVSIFITVLLVAHALMDYEFDIKSGKKTFCTVLGSKKKALLGLFSLIACGYLSTILIVVLKIIPWYSLLIFVTLPLTVCLYKGLNQYIEQNSFETCDFMKNFKIARNISVFYNLILFFSIII